jgi:SanA protein
MVSMGKWGTGSRRVRWGLLIGAPLGCLILAGGLIFYWPRWVENRYSPRIFAPEAVQAERVAIVFGARVYNSGRLSGMLRDRVDTAIDLYRAGKVQKLLLSGDNQFADYNEPGAMMDYAIAQGVPAEDIQPDYGGRRTYDTCYRARAVFQVESAILVTQRFHLPRALFLCEQLGIRAVGVAADRRVYDPRSVAFSETREVPATIAALLDVIRRAPPPVLGEPIPIE